MKKLIATVMVIAINAAFGYVSAAVADTMSSKPNQNNKPAKESADK